MKGSKSFTYLCLYNFNIIAQHSLYIFYWHSCHFDCKLLFLKCTGKLDLWEENLTTNMRCSICQFACFKYSYHSWFQCRVGKKNMVVWRQCEWATEHYSILTIFSQIPILWCLSSVNFWGNLELIWIYYFEIKLVFLPVLLQRSENIQMHSDFPDVVSQLQVTVLQEERALCLSVYTSFE